jgi:hypothetical protein
VAGKAINRCFIRGDAEGKENLKGGADVMVAGMRYSERRVDLRRALKTR